MGGPLPPGDTGGNAAPWLCDYPVAGEGSRKVPTECQGPIPGSEEAGASWERGHMLTPALLAALASPVLGLRNVPEARPCGARM